MLTREEALAIYYEAPETVVRVLLVMDARTQRFGAAGAKPDRAPRC